MYRPGRVEHSPRSEGLSPGPGGCPPDIGQLTLVFEQEVGVVGVPADVNYVNLHLVTGRRVDHCPSLPSATHSEVLETSLLLKDGVDGTGGRVLVGDH